MADCWPNYLQVRWRQSSSWCRNSAGWDRRAWSSASDSQKAGSRSSTGTRGLSGSVGMLRAATDPESLNVAGHTSERSETR